MKTKQLVYMNSEWKLVTTTKIVADTFNEDHSLIIEDLKYYVEANYEEDYLPVKKKCLDCAGGTIYEYELDRYDFEMLVSGYKESHELKLINTFIQEFEWIAPSIFNTLAIIKKEQEDAVLELLETNTEVSRQFKRGIIYELDRRAKIIELQKKELYDIRYKIRDVIGDDRNPWD